MQKRPTDNIGSKSSLPAHNTGGPNTPVSEEPPPPCFTEDDRAWFQLFELLEKYGPPGMLETAFAETPDESGTAATAAPATATAPAALGIDTGGQALASDPIEEDEDKTRAKVITKLVNASWIDEEDLEKKVLPFLKAHSD